MSLFSPDVLQTGIWHDASALTDPSLTSEIPALLDLQLHSKAPSTLQKYRTGWSRWRNWATSKIGVPVIPAKPLHVALFISELHKASVANNTGFSTIQSVIYSIKWAHNLAGIEDCPTSHPLVKSSLEGAKRILARPVQPQEPLQLDTVEKIAEHYASSNSLAAIRFLFILLVGFAGFFRLNEIQNMQLKDVQIFAERMSVRVPKRKNDQYREGHSFLLVRSIKSTCAVAITEKRILKSRSAESFHASKGVSYSTLRDEFSLHQVHRQRSPEGF